MTTFFKKSARLFNRFTFGYFTKNHFLFFKNYYLYWCDWRNYRRLPNAEPINFFDLQPCLNDRQSITGIDYYYFYQDMWGANKVFDHKPQCHVDIGSSAWFVGMLSQFTRVISIDVRPLDVILDGLEPIKGDIRQLPFADGTLESLSSLCVIEHIGLGRYGDELDPLGTERAIKEFKRVLKLGGNVYVSVPIDRTNKTYFNANRAFEVQDFIKRFAPLKLAECKFIQGNRVFSDKEFDKLNLNKLVVGLFHFIKI